MTDEQLPSPGGEERSNDPSLSQGNEVSGRGDAPSGESTATKLASLRHEELLELATRQDELVSARNRDLAASKQEALRLKSERDKFYNDYSTLETQHQLLRNQVSQQPRHDPYANVPQSQRPAQEQRPQPSAAVNVDTSIAQRIADASIQGDYAGVQEGLQTFGNSLYNRWTQDATRTLTMANQQQAAISSLQNLAGNLASDQAFGQRVLQRYAQLESDPQQRVLNQNSPMVPIPGMDRAMNYQMLRDAIYAAKGDMTSTPSQSPDTFIEPGTRTGPSGPSVDGSGIPVAINVKNAREVRKLLTRDELSYIDSIGGDAVKHFANLPPQVKAARIDAGKPLTAKQAGLGDVVFRIE